MTDDRDYDELLEACVSALRDDDRAAARRVVMRARDEGVAAGLELTCLALEDDDAAERRFAELESRLAHDRFSNRVGITMSDAGEALEDERPLLLAERWFRRIVERDPDPIAFMNHGEVLYRLDRDEQALATFERVAELEPERHAVHRRIGQIGRRLGDHDRAARGYRAYLAAVPDDAHEWISLAIVECDAGRYPEADQAYWRAAGLEPDNLSLHYNWFVTADRSGDRDRAEYAQRRLREIDAGDWRAGIAEALLLEATDPPAALRVAEAAFVELAEDDAGVEHVAERVLAIACRNRLVDEARRFIDRLFDGWVFPQGVLEWIRELDGEARELGDFAVQVDARYPEEGVAAFVRLRVYARSAEEAAAFAEAFERRCGADAVTVDEVGPIDEPAEERHPGVWWRSGVSGYPIEQFGEE